MRRSPFPANRECDSPRWNTTRRTTPRFRGTPAERMQGHQGLYAYVQQWIERRRANPGSDLLSKIVNARVNGQPLGPDVTFGMLANVIFGGLDTVAASLSFVTRWLAENPQAARQLASQPDMIAEAQEEFYRRFGIPQTARLITGDFDYCGVPHAAFGDGPHRCPGSFLARQELRIFLEEWLARIPEFRIKPGAHAVTSSGMVNGVLSLPLVWET